jgi:predicted permease
METLFQDLRFALRGLRKNPGLTLVAALSLGLGIGANTTVFTWMQSFVLRPLPAVAGYDRLVGLHTRAPGGGTWSVSYPDYRDWRAQSRTLDIAAFDDIQLGMRVGGAATERVWGELCSGNYFDVLGVRPALGRTFLPDEEERAAQVAVLNYAYWQRRFSGDSSVIGRSIVLNGQAFTIVGVSSPRFGGPIVGLRFDLFIPITTRTVVLPWGDGWRTQRQWQSFAALGRMRPGVTFEQARQEIDVVAKAAGIAGGVANHQGAVAKRLGDEGAASWLRPVFGALLAVTGIVLLIACANVANLLLARAAARRREVGIRLAVGASRTRLVRQLLTESLALALIAGAIGVVVALWARDLMMVLIPAAPFPIGLEFRVDLRVLGFALGVTLLTALLFGLAPALQASNPDLVPTLKDDIGFGHPKRARLQSTLVVSQVALSLVSLVCAGLFLRSLLSARTVDAGFRDPEHVLLVSTDLTLAGIRGDSATTSLTQRLLERVRAVPGVDAAAAAEMVPLGFGGNSSSGATIEGYQPRPNENTSIRRSAVTSDYFRVMGIPIVRGRPIGPADVGGPLSVVVNETFARRYWPGLDPIGRRVYQGAGWMTVVGVAKDGKYSQLSEDPEALIYQPMGYTFAASDFTVHVRATGEPTALAPALRRAFGETSADLPFLDMRTMAEHMQAALFVQRIGAYLLAGFGLIALLLCGIGIYGVLSYGVSQRTREIGVRVALGAGQRNVVGLVVGRAMRLSAVGLVIGLGAALLAGQLLRAQLFGISPRDPFTFASIALLLGAVALVASWIPARRAARVDPIVALRSE